LNANTCDASACKIYSVFVKSCKISNILYPELQNGYRVPVISVTRATAKWVAMCEHGNFQLFMSSEVPSFLHQDDV